MRRVELALVVSLALVVAGYLLADGGGAATLAAVLLVPTAGAIAIASVWWLLLGPGRAARDAERS